MAEKNEEENDNNSEILELLVKHLEKSSLNDLLEKDQQVALFDNRTWFNEKTLDAAEQPLTGGKVSGLHNLVHATQMPHPQIIPSLRSVEAFEQVASSNTQLRDDAFIEHIAQSLLPISGKSKQPERTIVGNPGQPSIHMIFPDDLNNPLEDCAETSNQWRPDHLEMSGGPRHGWNHVQNQQQQDPQTLEIGMQQMPSISQSQNQLLFSEEQIFSPDPQYKNVTAIWFGALEWQERKKPTFDSDARFVHFLPCYVMAINSTSIGDKIKADNWPSKLLMQMIPQQLLTSLTSLVRNSIVVSFHFDNSNEATKSLSRILASGFVGCIHVIHSARPSDVQIILLLYNKKKNVHVGLIPKDQNGFVQAIRRVIIHHKQAQLHKQQSSKQTQKSQLKIQQCLQDAENQYEMQVKEKEQQNHISDTQKQLLQQKHQQFQQHQLQHHHLLLLEQQKLFKHQELPRHEQLEQQKQDHIQRKQQYQQLQQQQHLQQDQQHQQMHQQQQHLQQELQYQLHQQLQQQQHLQQEQQHRQIQQRQQQHLQQDQHLHQEQQHQHLQQQYLQQNQQLQQLHQHQHLQQEQQQLRQQQLQHRQLQLLQQTNIQQQQQSIESNQLCQLLNQQQGLQLSLQQHFTQNQELAWTSNDHQESMTSSGTQPRSLEQWKEESPYLTDELF